MLTACERPGKNRRLIYIFPNNPEKTDLSAKIGSTSLCSYIFLMLCSISDIKMDIAVPHVTGSERALEVEECACPIGYRGASCQVGVQTTSANRIQTA